MYWRINRHHFILTTNVTIRITSLPMLNKAERIIFYSSYKNNEETNLKNFYSHKKLFALCLFSSSILFAWILKEKKSIQQEKLFKKCKRIILDENLFGTKVELYKCHGYTFPRQMITSRLFEDLPNFEFHSDDIIVASFPKSGTTWVQEIVYMLSNNFVNTDASSEVLENRFPYLEYPFPGIQTISKIPEKRLIKTHLPFSLLPDSFKESGARLIYITRNPKDVAVSYWHFMKLLTIVSFKGPFEDFLNMFITDKVPYAPYFEHLKSYKKERDSSNILILSYEDMKKNQFQNVKNIAYFLGISITDSDIDRIVYATSFTAMSLNPSVNYEHWKNVGFAHKNEGKFMRKGEVDDWKNYFTSPLIEKFNLWENKNSIKAS